MHLKKLLDNLLIITFLGAVAFGLYRYLQSPPDPGKQTTRYQENDQEILFDETTDESAKLDDCERYMDRNIAENCAEIRKNP